VLARQRGPGRRIGWKLDAQSCPMAGRAEDRDPSAKGLDAVFEPDDACVAARVGAAYAIVADREGEGAVTAVHAHVDDRCLRVLCDVGNRLRRDVVTRRLDVLTKPRQLALDLVYRLARAGPLRPWSHWLCMAACAA
jgi:hypothetical protein